MTGSMVKTVLILFVFIALCSTRTYSQDEMKKKEFVGIQYFELSNKELKTVLAENNFVEPTSIKGDYIYQLSDGKVLFEMRDVTSFLFSSKSDFDEYIERTETPQPIGGLLQTYTHPIKDSSFIEKREMYITFFVGQHNTEIDVADAEELDKLDAVLNGLSNEELKKYRLSIVALIGEFITTNLEGAYWTYLNIPNPQKERSPVVMVDDKILIDPANIFYEEYNQRGKNPNYKIAVGQAVKEYLKN